MRFFSDRPRRQRLLAYGGLATLATFLLIQAVPYGRNHSNPPVTQEPKWTHP